MEIKLKNNLQWRKKIINKMKKNKHKLFYDLDCIQGLEKFLTNIVTHEI